MNIQSIILLKTAIRLLVQALEILNKIPENDYREIVIFSQKETKYIKGVTDNITRGNLFMTIFFLREILESVSNK
jgi:hypothetical protein